MIFQQETGILPRIILPEIEFSVDRIRVERGQTVTLQWRIQQANEAALFVSTILPKNPEHLNWLRIKELGEKVELNNSLKLTVEETTAFYLVAQSQQGLRGAKAVVEVAEKEAEHEPVIWEPQEQFLEQMQEGLGIEWIEETVQPTPSEIAAQIESALRMTEQWLDRQTLPVISIVAKPKVIFADESSTVSWQISNANCADMSIFATHTKAFADSTKISGNWINGTGYTTGGSPKCSLSMKGNDSWAGQAYNQGHIKVSIHASNPMGKSATKSTWIDILSTPQFKGTATAKRQSEIRNAIKDIDKKLRNGCIYNNAALDQKVAAFKDGHLNRKQFSARLLVELQNLKLVTFHCKDVADKDWEAGHWVDYTNEILLEWSPKYTPYLEYVILHELTHKCGFNSDLLKYYSKASIENQAHLVSGVCFS